MLKWIQGALGIGKKCHRKKGAHHRKRCRVEARHKGALHRQLHVPVGEKIPTNVLRKAVKRGGLLARRARAALTLRKMGRGR